MPLGVGSRRVVLMGGMPSAYLDKVRYIARGSLIGLWPLGEQSGSVAADVSGRGHNGSYTGVSFVVPGAELLGNGGFETAGAGGADVFLHWSEDAGARGTIEAETTIIRSGAKAAKLTRGSGYVVLYVPLTVVPGATYTWRFWARGDGTNAGRFSIWNSEAGAYLDGYAPASTGVTGEEYTEKVVTFTVPTGCTAVNLQLWAPAASGGITYFDDVSLAATTPNGIGDGRTSPFYDGIQDRVDLSGSIAGLAAAFNPSAGTMWAWGRVSGAGVWSDGAARGLAVFGVNVNNRFLIARSTGNNELLAVGFAGATGGTRNLGIAPSTDWFCAGIRWKDGTAQGLLNGVPVGATWALGNWAGSLIKDYVGIGDYDSDTAVYPWSGLIGPTALSSRWLNDAECWAAMRV